VAGKSLDRQARQLVSSELAGSILATFEQLGGTADMVKWAKANRTVFYTQVLARLMPAPQKDEPDVVQNNQFNIGNLSETEAAIRVAFALSKAIYPDPSRVPPIDITPVGTIEPQEYVNPNQLWTPPSDAPDPDKQRWVEELPLTAEQRADQALMRQTRTDTLENYAGGPGEQGGSSSVQRQSAERDPRSVQREQMLRRKQLL
jgi:hypothetical protein